MKINDIITMAKAGYTPTEIKNAENRDDIISLLKAGIKKDNIDDYVSLCDVSGEQHNDDIHENDNKEGDADAPDYKAMYENLLKNQQKDNANEDMSGEMPDENESDIERIKKIIKEIK